MKQIVEEDGDFMFYIKLLPLKIHPAAYRKSKTIICEQSLRLLERAFDGKAVPEPTCETTEVDDTIEVAERLGISGTPTLVLPDGGVVQGFRDAGKLMDEIREAGLAMEERERKALTEMEKDGEGAADMEQGAGSGSLSEPESAEDEAGFGEAPEKEAQEVKPQEEEISPVPYIPSPM